MATISNGWHELTGVGRTRIVDEWNGYDIDGIVLEIDGQSYVAYEDPNDGYRSYGSFRHFDGRPQTTFPAQRVRVSNWSENSMDDGGYPRVFDMMSIYNSDMDLIVRIGTDHSDSYYPRAIFHYHPENLPINKNR